VARPNQPTQTLTSVSGACEVMPSALAAGGGAGYQDAIKQRPRPSTAADAHQRATNIA
jgi:hypothetical protein